MKLLAIAALIVACAAAQAGEMKGADMKGDMKDMSPSGMSKDAKGGKHVAKGTVKGVDQRNGTVTLNHEAVKSMNWPAMSMTFRVEDKRLMEKLGQGKKVEVEFEQRGKDYVITTVK